MHSLVTKAKRGLLLVICIALLLPGIDASAETKRQRAMKAYNRWLSAPKVYVLKKGEIYWNTEDGYKTEYYTSSKPSEVKFGLQYIDGDSIPELIVYGLVGGVISYGIITFKNGKLCRVYDIQCARFEGSFYKTGYFLQSNGLDGFPSCYEAEYYQMLGTKAVKKYSKTTGHLVKDSNFILGKRKVGAAEFNRRIAAQTNNRKLTKIKYYKNTSANRATILK